MKQPKTLCASCALAALFAFGTSGWAQSGQAGDGAAPPRAVPSRSDVPATGPQSKADSTGTVLGTTTLTRSSSANEAFAQLNGLDSAFLTREQLTPLPGFGSAFALGDHDGDGRLDRSEFTDAWNAYVGAQAEDGQARDSKVLAAQSPEEQAQRPDERGEAPQSPSR